MHRTVASHVRYCMGRNTGSPNIWWFHLHANWWHKYWCIVNFLQFRSKSKILQSKFHDFVQTSLVPFNLRGPFCEVKISRIWPNCAKITNFKPRELFPLYYGIIYFAYVDSCTYVRAASHLGTPASTVRYAFTALQNQMYSVPNESGYWSAWKGSYIRSNPHY